MRGHDVFRKSIQAEILSVVLQTPGEDPIQIDLDKGHDPLNKQDETEKLNVGND